MVIKEKVSIFEAGANVLINPVNCVGTMGKGLALEFKKRFPDLDTLYKNACKPRMLSDGSFKQGLEPGFAYLVDLKACQIKVPGDPTDHIFLFTTKNDWRNESRLCWIQSGLEVVRTRCHDYLKPEDVIAIPKLGAGLGGLPEEAVIELIEKSLESVPQKVILCI